MARSSEQHNGNHIRCGGAHGIPQGAVVSPLLSNVCLHYVYDLWAHRWRHRRSGDVIIVRYADDGERLVPAQGTATRFLKDLREQLARFGLELHPKNTAAGIWTLCRRESSRSRGEGRPDVFDFFGFTPCCGRSGREWFKVVRADQRSAMRKTLVGSKKRWNNEVPLDDARTGQWLERVVRGSFDSFCSTRRFWNRLDGFRRAVCKLWRGGLMHRGREHPPPMVEVWVG